MRSYLGRHGVCFVVQAGRQSGRLRVVSTLDTNVFLAEIPADHGGASVGAGGVGADVEVIVVESALASELKYFVAVLGPLLEVLTLVAPALALLLTVVVAELEWFVPVLERLIMVASVIALLASELEWLVVVVVAVAVAAVPVLSLVAFVC
ncbi:hypothetical protein PF001_g26077 [Phytophthora fragariae]|uniref:Uncharacterized protein n=1 Tax=Phytophthora fragariae TaxID=53985 RepID=A0A6A4BN58_9STRA|nr:hypothetical protein PF001_g26077 [Phytophthora fragariae]